MSKQTKRDATEAFGENENPSAVPEKRTRRKSKHKDSARPVAVPKPVKQESGSSLEINAIGPVARPNQPTINHNARTQNPSGTKGALSSGSGHKKRYKGKSSHSAEKASENQSTTVAKLQEHSKKGTQEHKTKATKSWIKRRKDRSDPPAKSGWTKLIDGGYFLDQDPLLSQDEQYFLLPTKSHVHVYSATTSLLVRSIFIGLADSVTSCIICPSDPGKTLVSTYEGTITKYNWGSGQKLRMWKTSPGLIRIYALSSSKSGDNGDIVLAINHTPGGKRDLSRLDLSMSPELQLKKNILRSQERMASTIVTLEDGKVILGFGGDRVMFGSSRDSSLDEYTWRDFRVPGKIASFDARRREELVTTSKTRAAIDLVVGLQDGGILILDDILTSPKQGAKSGEPIDRIFRRLHWHRETVAAVKWSRDGNYVISGGYETVLVIWQLDTNQQQYLPHLSTSICNIVVSSSGSSYTLKLADNSVMMLSTNDLIAKANIRGVSVSKELDKKPVVAMNPSQPGQLFLATPSDLSLNRPSACTMLQTFDLTTRHEVFRQALVRNLATAVNVDLNGQRILGPDVVQLQISHDGLWLAAVDEWAPPDTDRRPLDLHVNDPMLGRKTEIHLKFWSLQKESQTWEMNTKVEGPHSAIPHSVLQLASNPTRVEFASVGRDGYLRIWRPLSRQRNGMPIKDEAGELLYTWTCHRELRPNPSWPTETHTEAESAALCYSEDGSAIAVSIMFAGRSRILHIVDSKTGVANDRGTEAHLCPPGNVEMTFSGQNLILLSDRLLVWDVVDTMLVCDPIILKEPFVQEKGKFLAANAADRTFALALNPRKSESPGVFAVLDANQPGKVLHYGKIHGHVKALLPSIKGPGYVVVDGEARIVQIRPVDLARDRLNPAAGAEDQIQKSLNDIFGSPKNDVGTDATIRGATLRIPSRERPTSVADHRPKTLEEVFEQQTFSAPWPVSELFEKVAGLFRKA